ncbi:hypothetical protein [Pengzhenrongella sicca]|uniref:N-acetyltransferase domain-containing protein n=1 Tax=Pengzhenrongella sicca TaxID=2819238 RepID=A0A8A4ZAS1_9MICO|nr:hypothetical protein [Pengzhenrongella sicca]QTE28511.1 hypothetical protein J4E96_14185 [Pengzhenrongella sicca]
MIAEVRTPEQRSAFVRLPARLNRRGTYEQAGPAESALLAGTHPLSGTLTLRAWLAVRGGDVVGRIALTTYPGDERTGYVGFLEATDDLSAAELFDAAAQASALEGRTALVGPVDASFWWRYRLKVTGFDERPYFGEPLNPPSHVRWWQQAGYAETDRYRSAYTVRPGRHLVVPRFEQRARLFAARGFEVRAPRPAEWDDLLGDLFGLLGELYADFPTYRAISAQTFRELFAPMRQIADFSVLRMAYRDGLPVGFLVAFPDYGVGLASASRPRQLATLARHRWRSDRYVLLYLGARHPGLGSALMHSFSLEMVRRRAAVIGALSHVTKPTAGYAAAQVRARSDYLLLRREL